MPATEVLSRFAQTHEHLTFGHVITAVAVTVLRGNGEGTIYRVEILEDYQPGRTRFIARYWEEREVNGQNNAGCEERSAVGRRARCGRRS